MEQLDQAISLAATLPEKCGRRFVLDELRRNTRMSLSSARIVLLSALVSHDCELTEQERDNVDTLMRLIEEIRAFQPGATPTSNIYG